MTGKERAMLNTMFSVYETFYPLKDSFKNNYFKYSPDDIKQFLETISSEKQASPQKRTSKIKVQAVANLKTKAQAQNYYYENMIYDRADSAQKQKLIKMHNKADFIHIYTLLYGVKPASNLTKEQVLDEINRYFDNIDRAKQF